MLKDDRPDIQVASTFCLFQLAKHCYGKKFIEKSAIASLRCMLHKFKTRKIRVASLQCLSQLILESSTERTGCQACSPPCYTIEAQAILVNEPELWLDIIFDLIGDPQSESERIVGLSCVARLAKIEQIQKVLMGSIKSFYWISGPFYSVNRQKSEIYKDIQSQSHGMKGFLAILLGLLQQPKTRFYAISVLQCISAELDDDIIFDKVQEVLFWLMSMIQDGHPRAKGIGVLCLSKYFKKNDKFRQSIIKLKPDLITMLTTKLFGINSYCFPEIEAVKTAFLAIVTHDDAFNKLHDTEVINIIVKTLCIEGWLDLEGRSSLLYKLLSKDVKDGDVNKSLANEIINKVVLESIYGNTTRLDQTQTFFVELYHNEKLKTVITELWPNSIQGTIIKALNQLCHRAKAMKFLTQIAKDESAQQLMLEEHLLHEITQVGKSIIRKKSVQSVQSMYAFIAVDKKDAVNDSGTLSAVRATLEMFASQKKFCRFLLDDNVFKVITNGITTDDLKSHKGHCVEVQIAGVKCLNKLINFEPARQKMLQAQIPDKLMCLWKAFNDEPDSSQWLRCWPNYGDLLKDTLKQLREYDDVQEFFSGKWNQNKELMHDISLIDA
ncbi:hypothetical protein IW261DRAFT_1503746 [Armillaria novae-zelandiae]|uniref:Uncharacterized protein n=1 Tax=Armillaria novae-zelandiae TaxID=153914 RepID=A0AA39TYL5_9AGAR|nr:hypothetical protein IW261DRAFT_1503746 [Armillaria novae-zelandiae]